VSDGGESLDALRLDALRLRMQLQRAVIAERIGPARGEPAKFPRSLSMRLLLRHPWLIARLLAGARGPDRRLLRAAGVAAAVFAATALARRTPRR
jgi:hypothetical protein